MTITPIILETDGTSTDFNSNNLYFFNERLLIHSILPSRTHQDLY